MLTQNWTTQKVKSHIFHGSVEPVDRGFLLKPAVMDENG